MQIKFNLTIAFAVIISLGASHAIFRATLPHPSAPDDSVAAKEQAPPPQPREAELLADDITKEVPFVEKQYEIPNTQSEEVLLTKKREPEPEFFDETRRIDSVDVGEIALTDALLAYDIADDQIDEILGRIREGSAHHHEDENSSQEYLNRVNAMIYIIRQSDLTAEQLTMIIDDIFPQ
jgi:hypothetical protein